VDIFINSIFLYEDKMVITFNWKNSSKTVTLAELDAADEVAGNYASAACTKGSATNVLSISDFRSSHLDGNRPPFCDKSEPLRSPIVPVGDGFGFVRWVKW
jgi:hypothetical protein